MSDHTERAIASPDDERRAFEGRNERTLARMHGASSVAEYWDKLSHQFPYQGDMGDETPDSPTPPYQEGEA